MKPAKSSITTYTPSPKPIRKKFCKYCWDRGLSTEICFSHYVKDKKGPDGVIVCPTLLADQCMRCGEYGHTPRYCASLTPLLTLYNPTGDALQCNMEISRMIDKESWIEPIPAHLCSNYISWKCHRKESALARRSREMVTSRHGIFAEYVEDVGEIMIGMKSLWSTDHHQLSRRRHEIPYSDYELEVLAILDVNREMLREYFPNGCTGLSPADRHKLNTMVIASQTIFYGLHKQVCGVEHVSFHVDDGADVARSDVIKLFEKIYHTKICRPTAYFDECLIDEFQTRVLAKLEITKYIRDPVKCLYARSSSTTAPATTNP